jgi:TetR/AcrR family transcriptional regulator, regulator of autoinduction and epiphytic fitness
VVVDKSSAELKKTRILDAALSVVGHFGIKKSSVDELARAAGLSKQGLYLHFESKEELLAAAADRYFGEGLRLVTEALQRPGVPLEPRLIDAMDAWFGRHLAHFNPATLEVVEPRDAAATAKTDEVKRTFRSLLSRAIARSPEYQHSGHSCTPEELAAVLFQFGLTWKEGHPSRETFRDTVALCVRACLSPRRTPVPVKGGKRR